MLPAEVVLERDKMTPVNEAASISDLTLNSRTVNFQKVDFRENDYRMPITNHIVDVVSKAADIARDNGKIGLRGRLPFRLTKAALIVIKLVT